METLPTARFREVQVTYQSDAHASTYIAVAVLAPRHVVVREHSWADRFGPVPGTHFTEYTCSCGATATGRHITGSPRSSDLAELDHDPVSRAASEAADAVVRDRIAAILGHTR